MGVIDKSKRGKISRNNRRMIKLGDSQNNKKQALYYAYMLDWIGLDLFNDDTRPSGNISRPTQVNVSELLSFSKQLLKSNNIVQSGG